GRTITTDYTSLGGANATARLLSKEPRPTAIIYDSDIMAVAGLSTAQELGLSVPEELSLASFDDSILCEVVRPALTACARDVQAYGATAARALVSVIEGEDVPLHGEQSSVLVARASTAEAPGRVGAWGGQ
ncbi:MAG TPA: substrate-binding domain-containing protein, partial [Acidimicrobiales bacterium]|nr:substrate-binding domain-containing protein [Acidimicrobiales bacterium]